MSFLRKYGAKLFFGISCVLLIASLAFSAVSFARYVSKVEHGGGAGTATIDCSVTAESSENTFVNAAYMQKVSSSGTTQPVRMNNWADSDFEYRNTGEHGINYEYSFVFYMPKGFAENMMFQVLELDVKTVGETIVKTPIKASNLYKMSSAASGSAVRGIEQVTQMSVDGTTEPISNEYKTLIDKGGLLDLDCDVTTASAAGEPKDGTSYVVESDPKTTSVKTTFSTIDGVTNQIICPVSFMREDTLEYFRFVVNMTVTETKAHVLTSAAPHHFRLRTVLLNARDPRDYNITFDSATFGYTEDDIETKCVPIPEVGFDIRWKKSGGKVVFENGKPVLEAAVKNANGTVGDYVTVSIGSCMGLGSPCRVAAIFVQSPD